MIESRNTRSYDPLHSSAIEFRFSFILFFVLNANSTGNTQLPRDNYAIIFYTETWSFFNC